MEIEELLVSAAAHRLKIMSHERSIVADDRSGLSKYFVPQSSARCQTGMSDQYSSSGKNAMNTLWFVVN